MNRNQFITYVNTPESLGEKDSVLLAGLIKDFPYFQTAHLLYAKSLHNQNSIHYNNQLKVTAAHAIDRQLLHKLITKPSVTNGNKTKTPTTKTPDPTPIKNQPSLTKKEDVVIPPTANINKEKPIKKKTSDESSPSIIAESASVERKIASQKENLADKIAQKVIEQLNVNKPTPPKKTEESTPKKEEKVIEKPAIDSKKNKELVAKRLAKIAAQRELITPLPKKIIIEKKVLIKKAIEVNKEVEKESPKTFILPKQEKKKDSPKKEVVQIEDTKPNTFSGWLKGLSVVSPNPLVEKESPIKKIDATETSPAKKVSQNLIETFLEKKPRISKPKTKATFYSPTDMAKKSVEDDITFMSETLAKIYLQQENYAKASEAYEYLRLKYPEKNRIFASQIEKINNLIE